MEDEHNSKFKEYINQTQMNRRGVEANLRVNVC